MKIRRGREAPEPENGTFGGHTSAEKVGKIFFSFLYLFTSISCTRNSPSSDFGFGGTNFTANHILPVDWNADGYCDILAATTNSVTLSTRTRALQPGGAPSNLLTGVAIQEVVLMDLNGDI